MVLLLIPAAVILLFFVSYGMAFLARPISGGWIGWLTGAVTKSLTIGLSLIPGATSLAKWLTHQIGNTYAQVESQGVGWLVGLKSYLGFVAQSQFAIGYDLYRFAQWTVNHFVPQAIKAATHELHSVTSTTAKIAGRVERVVVKIPTLTKAQIQQAIAADIPGVIGRDIPLLKWLERHWKEIAAAGGLAGVIGSAIPWGGTIPGVKGIPKAISDLQKRAKRLEKLLGATGAAALVTTALAKLGLGWMPKCNNLKRVGPSFCGASLSALIGLFAGLAAVAGTFNLVDFAKLVQDGISDGEGLVRHFWDADTPGPGRDRQLGESS